MRIGIVSPWYERGIAYVSLNMRIALIRGGHEVFILAKPGTPRPKGDEWKVPNLTVGSGNQFGLPTEWAKQNRLDALIFNERHDTVRLAEVRRQGISSICLQEWESVDPDPPLVDAMNECFDAIIAPTEAAYYRFKEIGLDDVKYVPWGTDLELFHPIERDGPIKFFQPANFGGVLGRKNLHETRQAWRLANKKDSTLLITFQREGDDRPSPLAVKRGTLDRSELASYYRQSDVAILPSRWEGLGLCFMEALASGLAIITSNAPPMNSYVGDGYNGILCETYMKKAPAGVFVQEAMIEINSLVDAIDWMIEHPEMARSMGKNSRELAEQAYDWKVNGQRLAEVVEEVVNG